MQNNRYSLVLLACLYGVVSKGYAALPEEVSQAVRGGEVLNQMQSAAKKLNYTGVFVYQQGTQVRTSKITHVVSGPDELEKVEMLDGHQREYIRRNDEITRYIPDTKTLLIEKRLTRDIFPAILVANTNDLAQYYRVELKGVERIAGLNCQVIWLKPIDKFRYGYRLCADQDTHLLLRAQTLGENLAVVEQILFTQLTIGHHQADSVKPSFSDTRAWQIRYANVVEKISLPKWEITPPPGFKQIQAVKHVLADRQRTTSVPHQKSDSNKREVSQLVYSDGLAAISVFIEPDVPGRVERVMQQGAMNIIGRRHGQYWVTVMGEVPDLAIRQVINSIKLIN